MIRATLLLAYTFANSVLMRSKESVRHFLHRSVLTNALLNEEMRREQSFVVNK
jgi:hypothetical protein